MFFHYLSAALKSFKKHKSYAIINILGLAIGLAACLLIILFVRFETSYDNFLPDIENVYRIETNANIPGRDSFDSPTFFGSTYELLPQDYSEVEMVTRLLTRQGNIIRDGEDFQENLRYVDSNFFEVFKLPFLEGNIETALKDIPSVVLSRDMALKHLGDGPYVGRTITLNQAYERELKVTGIIENIPENSHLDLDIILPMDEKIFTPDPRGQTPLTQWNGIPIYVYMKLLEGKTPDNIKATINDWLDKYFPPEIAEIVQIKGSELFTPRIMPVMDIHLGSPAQGGLRPQGNMTTIYSFGGIALLILTIAAINFMNLATARSTLRAKEVAIQKVMGANRRQLFTQFEGESVTLALIALVLAIGIMYFVLPSFNDFTQRGLSLSLLLEPVVVFSTLGLTLFVGLIAGAHPAMVLSNIRPSSVLMSNQSSSPASAKLRSALVVFQFTISAALIIGTALIYAQTNYARNIELGYDKTNKMVFSGPFGPDYAEGRRTFKQRVLNLPEVKGAALANFAPGFGGGSGTSLVLPNDPNRIIMFFQDIDWDFLDLYKVKPSAGRLFSRDFPNDVTPTIPRGQQRDPETITNRNMIINEFAVKTLGFSSPEDAIGKIVYEGQNNTVINTIVGVVPDIIFNSPRQKLRGLIFFLNPDRTPILNIDYETDDSEALGLKIEEMFKEMFPGENFNRSYIIDNIDQQYQTEDIQGTLLGIFSGLAILVACMGLFGLASFTVTRRTKEIGLRKVMGASSNGIIQLLLRQFSIPVIIANVVAWPMGWYGMSEWIKTFEYRIDLAPYFAGVAVIAMTLTLVIAWVTVAGHAFKVSRTNPIRALRYEN